MLRRVIGRTVQLYNRLFFSSFFYINFRFVSLLNGKLLSFSSLSQHFGSVARAQIHVVYCLFPSPFARHMKRHITHILQLTIFFFISPSPVFVGGFFPSASSIWLIFYSIETDAHISRL